MSRTVFTCCAACLFGVTFVRAAEADFLSKSEKEQLSAGETVVLSRRPDETGEADGRFVTVARLIDGAPLEAWNVIDDKENAARFLDGVLESTVIERDGSMVLVEQRTRVGGPKGSYLYRLRHTMEPHEKMTFNYVGGELDNVLGAWWFYEGWKPGTCLLVYSLHIDAGRFAPQPIVKLGMKKSMPGTLRCVQDEVVRRRAGD